MFALLETGQLPPRHPVAFVFSLNADLVADPISSVVTRPGDLVFKGQIHSQSAVTTKKKDCVYTVTRLRGGLVYLYGRSDRAYVNKT